jgi:hypothetical protein
VPEALQPQRLQDARSRSPRGHRDEEDSVKIIEALVYKMINERIQGHDLERHSVTTDDKHGFIQNLANGAWKLDSSRRPLVLGEWKHSIRSYEIDSLRQSHDTVDPTFGHGPHEGNSVAELTDKLIVGECQPAELTKEFAHRCASRTTHQN